MVRQSLNQNFISIGDEYCVKSYPIPCVSDIIRFFIENRIAAREYSMNKLVEWNQFIDCYYVSKCIDFNRCTLRQWGEAKQELISYRYDRESLEHDNILLTIYDTDKDKHLVIDGLHRGRILSWCWDAVNLAENKEVKIWELQGRKMREIFPIDTVNF